MTSVHKLLDENEGWSFSSHVHQENGNWILNNTEKIVLRWEISKMEKSRLPCRHRIGRYPSYSIERGLCVCLEVTTFSGNA